MKVLDKAKTKTGSEDQIPLFFNFFSHQVGYLYDSLQGKANARNVSFRISLRRLIYIINSVDKTKLSLR